MYPNRLGMTICRTVKVLGHFTDEQSGKLASGLNLRDLQILPDAQNTPTVHFILDYAKRLA